VKILTVMSKTTKPSFRRRDTATLEGRLREPRRFMQVLNTALLTAESDLPPEAIRADGELWGRWTESAVGAHLANGVLRGVCDLYYWRHRNREVDFVVRGGGALVAIEVKSGRASTALRGLDAFSDAFAPTRVLLVGGDGIPVDEFLTHPVEAWLQG